jgi:hypothetical protein
MSCLLGHFLLNLRFLKTTIFEETLPDFIKEENTHPKGRGKKGTMSNEEERTTNVQPRDGKYDFAL